MKTNGNGNGSRGTQEIQAEIDRTRREMDGTLHAIENRLTPGQLYDQGMQYLRNNGGTEFLSNLGDQAKRNPMPVALVGIGLAWLMATGKTGSGTQPEYDSSGPGLGERASQAKAKLGETASSMRDRASQVRDTTRQQFDRAKSQLDTLLHDQPLALGAVGLAIGALAAALAPRTEQEERIAGKIDDMANPSPSPQDGESSRSMRQNESSSAPQQTKSLAGGGHVFGEPKEDSLKKARDDERERLQQGVKPYAERKESEPPV